MVPLSRKMAPDASARIVPVSRPPDVKVNVGADFRIVPFLRDGFAQLHPWRSFQTPAARWMPHDSMAIGFVAIGRSAD
jgi:hypothetical protein